MSETGGCPTRLNETVSPARATRAATSTLRRRLICSPNSSVVTGGECFRSGHQSGDRNPVALPNAFSSRLSVSSSSGDRTGIRVLLFP